jgi:hypothetical protein
MEKELEKFIEKAAKRNISSENLKDLLKQGEWSDSEIKEALNRFELLSFIEKARAKGFSKSKIRQNLLDAGWDKKEIDSALGGKFNLDMFPKPNFKIIGLVFLIFLVGFSIFYVFSNFSFGGSIPRDHYLDFQNIEFNETEYDSNLKSYHTNISKSCGKQTFRVTGKILGDSKDFSDTIISSNIGSLKVESLDSLGNFEFTIDCTENLIINFNKQGFVPLHKELVLFEGRNTLFVDLKKETSFESFNTNNPVSLEQDSVSLIFNQNSLINKKTNESIENAKVSLTLFDPTNKQDMIYFPGTLYGLGLNGQIVGLEPFGFFKIKVEDLNNNPLELKEDQSINISFKIASSQFRFAKDTIPLWNFDEDMGVWKYIGQANKNCISNTCYYNFNLEKVGSWISASLPASSQTNLRLNGLDIAVNNRVVSATADYNQGPSEDIFGNPIEQSSGGDMVCESGGIEKPSKVENWDRMEVKWSDDWLWLKDNRYGPDYETEIHYYGNTQGKSCICMVSNVRYSYGCYPGYCFSSSAKLHCGEDKDPCAKFSKKELELFEALIPYRDYILKASKEFNIPSEFIASLALAEFNHEQSLNLRSFFKQSLSPFEKRGPLDGRGFANMHPGFRYETMAIINRENVELMRSNTITEELIPTGIYIQDVLPNIWENTENNPLNTREEFVAISVENWRELYPGWNDPNFPNGNPEGEVRLVAASIAAMIILWEMDPKSNRNSIRNRPEIIGTIYNSGWVKRDFSKFFDPKEKPEPAGRSFSVTIDGESYPSKPFGERTKLFAESENLKDFLTNENSLLIKCLNSKKPDSQRHSKFFQFFNDLRLKLLETFITRGHVGLVILDLPKEKDISFLDGVDVVSGKIHYPINDLVYYSELDSLKDKLQGDLVIYDSFIVKDGNEYLFADNSGIFRLLENNSLIIEDSIIKIQDEFTLFEFGEKVGDTYYLTKKRFFLEESNPIDIEYFYEAGKLKKVEVEENSVIFNYEGNKLKSISYTLDSEPSLIEEFNYNNNKLSQNILKTLQGEDILQIDYLRTSDSFKIESPIHTKEYSLTRNKVQDIRLTSLVQNKTNLFRFEYDSDYTYITFDNYTTSCFKGICFIDELRNMFTTSPKCMDHFSEQFYSPRSQDVIMLRAEGTLPSSAAFLKDVRISPNNLNKNISLTLPSYSHLNLSVIYNGISSHQIPLYLNPGNFSLSDLIPKPKNCLNTQISFGGFSLD